MERAPNGYYTFQNMGLNILKIENQYIGVCVCMRVRVWLRTRLGMQI